MTRFSIEYNPYLVKCVFKKDGETLNDNSRIGAKSDSRLQVLLGESVNWRGLVEEIDDLCDDDEVNLFFKGRRIDFEDLEYAVGQYRYGQRFTLDFAETVNDMDVIKELDYIFEEIKAKNLPVFHEKNEAGKDVFDAYEDVKNGIFKVSVIATMSSGKSTLMNSILHTELLPSENRATTATVARIFDTGGMEGFEAVCYGADYKEVVHPRRKVNLKMLSEYNADKRVKYIDLEGSIPVAAEGRIRLCLQDTPGPNFTGTDAHKELTRTVIKDPDGVVLYVMNATQMGIEDDRQLLEEVSSEMKRAGKQSRDRFIFVVNKCDEMDEEKESLDTLLNDARKDLEKIGITEPTLIPTCAQLALMIRKHRKGEKLSRKQKDEDLKKKDSFVEVKELHLEEYATLTPIVREQLRNDVERYHADPETKDLEALVHSGVPAVEQTIREYIDKYAYPIKINDAVKDVKKIIGDLNMRSKFEKKIAESAEELDRVRRQIIEAQRKYESSKKVYEEYKVRIDGYWTEEEKENEKRVEQFSVERELQEASRKYDGKTKIDKIEADKMIFSFQEDLIKFQSDCKSRLNREIDYNMFRKSEEMLEEYSRMIKEILTNIEIDGYDFKEVRSFDRIRISNIDEIRARNEQDRYREQTYWKKNPKRKGFWGFFKFWVPKKISYTKTVKDGIDVNVKNIIVDVLSEFSASIKENVGNMYDQAFEQVEEYKKAFKDNIDVLDAEIRKILDELEQSTRDEKELSRRVEENKEIAAWFKEQEDRINKVLAF